MSGGGKKVTVGYWYKYLQAFALSLGKLDAVLEFRAGGRTAWRGIVTESSRIYVNAKNLWGGQKKEGGLQGYMDLQLGDADQAPNDYLTAQLGADQPSYRGKSMAIWRGGIWGAMNPYPKRAEFKVRRILQGWDNDAPWYPEKAEILLDEFLFSVDLGPESGGWRYLVTDVEDMADYSASALNDDSWAAGQSPFASTAGHPYSESAGFPAISNTVWPLNTKIWIRRKFDVGVPSAVTLTLFVDNLASVWINDTLLLDRAGTVATPSGTVFTHEVVVPLGVLVAGENTLVMMGEDEGTYSYAAFKVTAQGGSDLVGMNPAHILYDSLTANDMQGEPTALISDASFRAAADVLFDERFGLCTEYRFDEDIDAFQERILNVIGGALTQSREDGLYYLDLIRPTEDAESLPVIESDDILSLTLEPSSITEQVNELVVEWYDVEANKKKVTPPIQSRGAVHAAGQVTPDTVKYPEIPVEALALRVQARDLVAKSTPLMKGTLTTNRRSDLWRLRKGQKVMLRAAEDGVAGMVAIIGDVDYGSLKDGRIKMKVVEDVYSMPETTYVTPQSSQTPPLYSPPVAPVAQRLMEAPYVEVAGALSAADLAVFPDDSGAIIAMAAEPSSGLNYTLYTAPDGVDLSESGTGEWCPSALVVEEADYARTSFTIQNATGLDLVEIGTWALWDEEIVRVDHLNVETLELVVGRCCADTVEHKHDAGSRIWFCGEWGATDEAQYVDGDVVNAKLATRTATAELPLFNAPLLSTSIVSRANKPYPPVSLMVNDSLFPESTDGELEILCKTRNRLLQADQLIDASFSSITPEDNTTFSMDLRLVGSDTVIDSRSGLDEPAATLTSGSNGLHRLQVWSVRDGLESYQRLTHVFEHSTVASSTYEERISALAPFAYWKLNEAAGTTALDSSGASRNGVYAGTVILGAAGLGSPGYAVDMAGTGSIDVPSGSSYGFSGWTWGVTVNLRSLSNSPGLFHIGDYAISGNQGLSVVINANGGITIQFFSGGWRVVSTPDGLIAAGSIYKVVVRFDGATSGKIFVNGSLASSLTFPVALIAPPSRALRLGAVYSNGYFNRGDGMLDDIFVVNRLLTDLEILTLVSG